LMGSGLALITDISVGNVSLARESRVRTDKLLYRGESSKCSRTQFAPCAGLGLATLRLTGESSTVEHACYQRNRQEQRGGFGVVMARNSAKNSAKFALELGIRP